MSTPLRERPDAPLGTLIFRAGLLPAETIESALEEGVKTGKRLGEILTERGLLKEVDLARLLAGQKGLEFVTIREQIVDPTAARLFTPEQARLFHALPYAFEDGLPVVAIPDATDEVLTRDIREALGRDEIRFVVSTPGEIAELVEDVYSRPLPAPAEAEFSPAALGEPEPPETTELELPAEDPPAPETVARENGDGGSLNGTAPLETAPFEPALEGEVFAVPVPAFYAETPPPEPAEDTEPEPAFLTFAPTGHENESDAAPRPELAHAPAPELERPPDYEPASEPPTAAPEPAHVPEPSAEIAPLPVLPPVFGTPPVEETPPEPELAHEPVEVPAYEPELAYGPADAEADEQPIDEAYEQALAPGPELAHEPEKAAAFEQAPAPEAREQEIEPELAHEPEEAAAFEQGTEPEPGFEPDFPFVTDFSSAPEPPQDEPRVAPEPSPPAPLAEPTPVPFPEPGAAPPPPVPYTPAASAETSGPMVADVHYRVAVRLTNGERVDAGAFDEPAAAEDCARAVMAQVAAAGHSDWPFVSGRFLKPDTIVSVDIDELAGGSPAQA